MSEQPRSRSTDKRFYGVLEGIVTRVRNDGMAKVEFPRFDPLMESEWCRVLQFFAGPGHGAFFMPRVESEVLVAFIQGDMRYPVILGGLYNGVDLPPGTGEDFDTHVRNLRIQSFAGSLLSFLDPEKKGDPAAVVLQDAGGNRITLSTTGAVTIEAKGVLSFKAPHISINGRPVDIGNKAI
ncbi:MAG: phage baseplate assembly protein V [Sedimenticolaceae bacterium]